MALNEEDLVDDLAYEEAEGAAESWDEADELDEVDATDEYDESDELDEYEEGEAVDEADEWDEGDEYEATDEGEEWDEYEDADEDDDSFDTAIAQALSAEDSDEFFRRVGGALRRAARGAVRVARRAAPIIGRVARVAAPILSRIPHPAAQVAGRIGSVLGRLMADGASEEEALEAMAELAARNRRAVPVVAGLAVRNVMRSIASQLPLAQRRAAVRQVRQAAQTLVRRGGPMAIRALPRIVRSVRRTAAVRGTPAVARPRVIQRAAMRVAASPSMVRRLARPLPRGQQVLRRTGMGPGAMRMGMGMGMRPGAMRRRGRLLRSIFVRGPARILVRRP